METQQNDIIKSIEPLIDGFCKIILTNNDCFNYKLAREFIDNLTDSNKSDLNSIKEDFEKEIQDIALIHIINYLQGFHSDTIGSPFQFDSGDSFFQYRKYFEKYYASKNNNIDIPYVFKVVFGYIKSISDHYRIFEQFYNVRVIETADTILTKTQKQAENAVKAGVEKAAEEASKNAADLATQKVDDAANKAIKDASNKAQAFAELASESAKTAMEKAKDAAEKAAEEATQNAIKNEMNNVTKHISETSVTILGIFSGIVLTVVAGLFYSSSVLENINSANFFRLLAVSALVGLVCFGLIVIMFKFIIQISGKQSVDNNDNGNNNNNFFSDTTVKIVTISLIIVMIIGFVFQFIFPSKNKDASESTTNPVVAQTTLPKSNLQDDNLDKTSTELSTPH